MGAENPGHDDRHGPDMRIGAQIVARIVAGDDSAFDDLIRIYYADLLTYLTYAAGSRDVGEDLLQELLLQIWRKRQDLPEDGNIRPYLYAAARHRVLDYRRGERRAEHWTEEYLRDHDSGGETRPDWSNPITSLERTELEDAVQSAIQQLPERARDVWRLHREQGLSYQEIAQVMEISVNTVKTHMVRSSTAIRAAAAPFLLVAFILGL